MKPRNTPALRYGSVCSGIEAASLAWRQPGLEPAWFSEIDPFACAVLAHHYPDIPNLGDMTRLPRQVRTGAVTAPDILVGGTPCQSFSIAGARAGLSDPRGALTLSYVELANAIDQVRIRQGRKAAVIVWENVPGVFSDTTNAFGHFLGALAGECRPLQPPGQKWTHAGHVSGPRRRIAWRVLDAQFFGVAQRRRRVFLVASGRDDLDPAAILFESESLRRHPAPGHAPWQDAPAASLDSADAPGFSAGMMPPYGPVTVTASFGFGGGNTRGPIDIAACLTASPGSRHDFEVETFMVQSVTGAISHTLGSANNGKGCSEDGTGRGIPVITQPDRTTTTVQAMAFAQNTRDEVRLEAGDGHIVGTIATGGGKPGQGQPMILCHNDDAAPKTAKNVPVAAARAALSVCLRGRPGGSTIELGDGVAAALRTGAGGSDKAHVVMNTTEEHFVGQMLPCGETGLSAWAGWRVRRLMPLETERLQGFPDNYTLVAYRGKPAADAPRYRAIGNSIAVPCLAWIGKRLLDAIRHR